MTRRLHFVLLPLLLLSAAAQAQEPKAYLGIELPEQSLERFQAHDEPQSAGVLLEDVGTDAFARVECEGVEADTVYVRISASTNRKGGTDAFSDPIEVEPGVQQSLAGLLPTEKMVAFVEYSYGSRSVVLDEVHVVEGIETDLELEDDQIALVITLLPWTGETGRLGSALALSQARVRQLALVLSPTEPLESKLSDEDNSADAEVMEEGIVAEGLADEGLAEEGMIEEGMMETLGQSPFVRGVRSLLPKALPGGWQRDDEGTVAYSSTGRSGTDLVFYVHDEAQYPLEIAVERIDTFEEAWERTQRRKGDPDLRVGEHPAYSDTRQRGPFTYRTLTVYPDGDMVVEALAATLEASTNPITHDDLAAALRAVPFARLTEFARDF